MIKSSFHPQWWNCTEIVVVNPDRSISFRANRTGAANEYTVMEYNFSLFFGLAVQLYESTLVPDDSAFDRYDARQGQLTGFELAGKSIFEGKGKCQNCHGGAEFTNASVAVAKNKPITRMIVGNGQPAVYDEGFYNIAVRPTVEDIGVGGTDPWGNPLSFSRLFQKQGGVRFVPGETPNLNGNLSPTERVAVDGAHKTSTIRNVALTAPYFWNGGKLTLRQVIDFYNAGGDFRRQNIDNLDADIEPLGLSDYEKEALLAFLNTLTDQRVHLNKAPFDHPSLQIPLGGAGCEVAPPAGTQEQLLTIPEVGSAGYSTVPAVLDHFLGVNQNDAKSGNFPADNQVDLTGQYNVNAISSVGKATVGGGLDGLGNALASNYLGSQISWSGVTFNLGAANTPNGISGKTINIKENVYGSVKLLLTGVNGTQNGQAFKVNYTDGTSTLSNQNVSDWRANNFWLFLPKNQPVASSPQFRVRSNGSAEGNYWLLLNYGYAVYGLNIPLDKTKVVSSITLPANRNVVVLGIHMTPVGNTLSSKP